MDDGSDQQDVEKELSVMNVSLGRHAIPKGTDGEVGTTYLVQKSTTDHCSCISSRIPHSSGSNKKLLHSDLSFHQPQTTIAP